MTKQTMKRGLFMCALAACFYCYEYVLRIVPGIIEPELRQALGHLSASSFGALSAFYYFAYTPMQLPVGVMMDWVGTRKLLTIACLSCALGSWLFTLTPIFYISAIGRFLVGFGSAFAFVGVLKIADSWLPRQYLPLVAGLVTTLGMLGAVTGELALTVLIKTIGFHYVLDFLIASGVVLTVLISLFIKERSQEKAFVKSTRKHHFVKETLLVLANGQVWLVGLIGTFMFLSLSVFAEVWGKSYVITAFHMSEVEAALAVSLVFIGWGVGAPVMGWICDYVENKLLIILVTSCLAAVAILITLYVPGLSTLFVNILLFLYGFFCSAEILVFILGKECCDEHLSGTAFATVNMIVMFGGAFLQPLVGSLLDLTWSGKMENGLRVYSAEHYKIALSFLPMCLILSAILTFFVKGVSSKR